MCRASLDNPLSSQPDVQAGRRFAGNLENALQEAQAASEAALSNTSQYMADQLHLESQIASSAAAIGNVEGEQMATAEIGALEAEDETALMDIQFVLDTFAEAFPDVHKRSLEAEPRLVSG